MPALVGLPQEETGGKGDDSQPPASGIQAQGKGKAHLREGTRTPVDPIVPEAVFGQIKYNMQYKRFRHFGKDKVTMDFAFFAMAFNLKKMAAKMPKWSKSLVLGPFPGATGHKNRPLGLRVSQFSRPMPKMAA